MRIPVSAVILILFPNTAAVPAVSSVGLGAMVVVILAVGGFVFNRIKRQVANERIA